jgi:hypothetical protein
MNPIHCPAAPECYCNVFGLCDLKDCAEHACDGMYTLPQFSTQPWDWKPLPEFDDVSYEDEWLAAEAEAKPKQKALR